MRQLIARRGGAELSSGAVGYGDGGRGLVMVLLHRELKMCFGYFSIKSPSVSEGVDSLIFIFACEVF